jgi:alpha-tubulin suppressor-like RCC1 family protein
MRRAAIAVGLVASACSFDLQFGSTPIDAQIPTFTDAPLDEPPPPDSCMPVQVAASSAHNCARMQNGDVWCWGKNNQGEVGRPAQRHDCQGIYACNPSPEKVAITNATGLGLGDQHSCIIAGSDVYCMGANDSGQFGDDTGDSAVPILVAQRSGALELVAGDTHTCSRHGAQVRCSGYNGYAECGDGTQMQRHMPVIAFPSGAEAIGTGYHHMCAIDGGLVFCWGENGAGQVGGSGSPATVPRIVQNVSNAIAVTGGLYHTCALINDGTVRCWGFNSFGQLGNGTTNFATGVVLATVAGIVEISAGVNHTCARASGGTVYCWGEGYTSTPTAVSLPAPATQIASGSYHDCFVLAPSPAEPHGSVWCTGANTYGQLGRGPDPTGSLSPGAVNFACP